MNIYYLSIFGVKYVNFEFNNNGNNICIYNNIYIV